MDILRFIDLFIDGFVVGLVIALLFTVRKYRGELHFQKKAYEKLQANQKEFLKLSGSFLEDVQTTRGIVEKFIDGFEDSVNGIKDLFNEIKKLVEEEGLSDE